MVDWSTTVCIASGPSLNEQDCIDVKYSGLPVIVTNNTFQMCPWANVLYAMDRKWWTHYQKEAAEFQGRKICAVRGSPGAEYLMFRHGQNSGVGAIHLAAKFGAKKIILLGYDCQKTDGKAHWHGDHKKGMGNAARIGQWPRQFATAAGQVRNLGVEVVNCTRRTALECFPVGNLQDHLPKKRVINAYAGLA